MDDKLKEFYENYDYARMLRLLETAQLYGWQKERIYSAFISFRKEIRQAYEYHTTNSENKE